MNLDVCLHCMAGKCVNGVCTHCGKTGKGNVNSDALPPQSILYGRYYLGYPLGIGGFGITYAALDLSENVRVAIKELFPGNTVYRQKNTGMVLPQMGQEENFASFRLAFQREAQVLMQLQGQPGVVKLFHAFGENNTAYYVMEFLEGEDLRSYLQKHGPMHWQEYAPKLQILLDGLERLHNMQMIHRDISPDNVFMTRDGGCCLIDFGSARAYQAVDHFTTHLKKCFAPLEQFFSQSKQGPWTDIYSLCVTSYYTLTGVLPPTAPSRKQQDTMVPIRQLCPYIPQNVADAIADGMEIEATNRIQSVPELRDRLFPEGRIALSENAPQRQLRCVSGIYRGETWQLRPGDIVRFGRLADCWVIYPDGTQGVSRSQCTLYLDDNGKAYLRDDHSSYGTYFVTNGKVERIPTEQWLAVGTYEFGFGKSELFQIQ